MPLPRIVDGVRFFLSFFFSPRVLLFRSPLLVFLTQPFCFSCCSQSFTAYLLKRDSARKKIQIFFYQQFTDLAIKMYWHIRTIGYKTENAVPVPYDTIVKCVMYGFYNELYTFAVCSVDVYWRQRQKYCVRYYEPIRKLRKTPY